MTDTHTIDLQIFLGRASNDQPVGALALPSSLIAAATTREHRWNNRSVQSEAADSDPTLETGLPAYIAIANSEVVEILHIPFPLTEIRPLVERLSQNTLTLQQCVAWGTRLFDFVFHRSIRDKFRELLFAKTQLRVTIATSVPELIFLPWELMCDSRPGLLPCFLCYDHQVHLIRSLRLHNRIEVNQKRLGDAKELRILLVTSNPLTESYIDVLKEERMLRFVIDEAPALTNVRLEVLHEANVSSLRDRLHAFIPHVVHLACHGGYDSQQDMGFVALNSVNDPGSIDRVNSYRFAALVKETGTVQLVFVNTCYGAFQGEVSAFSGVAQCLHATGIAEVVALQFLLQDETAHAIVLNFYKHVIRDGRSIEDSITRVRRHLFINGYMFPETFGLAMYQGNESYAWSGHITASRISEDTDQGSNEIEKLFKEEFKKEMMGRVSLELKKHKELLRGLDSLSPEDILLSLQVFNDLPLALRIIKEVALSGVPTTRFLQMLLVTKVLAMHRHENQLLASAIVVMMRNDFLEYLKKYGLSSHDPLGWDIFNMDMKEIAATAIKVTGEATALWAIVQAETETVEMRVQNLPPAEASDVDAVGIDPKWKELCESVRQTGCALLLPGDGRLKLIIGGQQIAEFSGGRWRRANLKSVREGFDQLAKDEVISEKLCTSIMNKCLLASEKRCGLSLILQRADEVSIHPGYYDVTMRPDTLGLRGIPIYEIDDKRYLDQVAGDNATIITITGDTRAYNAPLVFSAAAAVEQIKGTGARHLSAQQVTAETDAIAFVVSADGPISVFRKGSQIYDFL